MIRSGVLFGGTGDYRKLSGGWQTLRPHDFEKIHVGVQIFWFMIPISPSYCMWINS
jgi:hypothetical protein